MVDCSVWVYGPHAWSTVDCVNFFLFSLRLTLDWACVSPGEGMTAPSSSRSGVLAGGELVRQHATVLGGAARGLYSIVGVTVSTLRG
jgi:hypothetical protein